MRSSSESIIEGCRLIPSLTHLDERGEFRKFFSFDFIKEYNLFNPRQVNISRNTLMGTIRGLHYQASPYSEYKLVSCIQGSIYDVVVDLRENSPTFGCWQHFLLNQNSGSLLVPPGLAHGFQTLEDNVILLYLDSSIYRSKFHRGINPFDTDLAIKWPLDCSCISNEDLKSSNFGDF